MIVKEGKVVHFTCDLCKVEEVKQNQSLLYRKMHDPETALMWDICDGCLEKMKEQLGAGRRVGHPLERQKAKQAS